MQATFAAGATRHALESMSLLGSAMRASVGALLGKQGPLSSLLLAAMHDN
jgi:hypothetical protein